MTHCPRCGRRFANDDKVLRHLNQPRSSCVNLDTSDLVSIPLGPLLPLNFTQPQNVTLEQEQDDPDTYGV